MHCRRACLGHTNATQMHPAQLGWPLRRLHNSITRTPSHGVNKVPVTHRHAAAAAAVTIQVPPGQGVLLQGGHPLWQGPCLRPCQLLPTVQGVQTIFVVVRVMAARFCPMVPCCHSAPAQGLAAGLFLSMLYSGSHRCDQMRFVTCVSMRYCVYVLAAVPVTVRCECCRHRMPAPISVCAYRTA